MKPAVNRSATNEKRQTTTLYTGLTMKTYSPRLYHKPLSSSADSNKTHLRFIKRSKSKESLQNHIWNTLRIQILKQLSQWKQWHNQNISLFFFYLTFSQARDKILNLPSRPTTQIYKNIWKVLKKSHSILVL